MPNGTMTHLPSNDYPILPPIPTDVIQMVQQYRKGELRDQAYDYLRTQWHLLETDAQFSKARAGFSALTLICSVVCPTAIPGMRLHYEVVKDLQRDAKTRARKKPLVDRIITVCNPKQAAMADVRDMLESLIPEEGV